MRLKLLVPSLAIVIVGLCSAPVAADYLEDFTTNQTAAFTFGAYDGNTTFTTEGLVVTIPASGDSFGGIGVAPVVGVDLTGVTSIEVTARLDAGNASDLILSVREDNGAGGDGEFLSYAIAASSFTEGSFVTVAIDPTSFFFNDGPGANGVLDGLINNTGIQSPFGGTSAQNYTVQSVNYIGAVAVPEPSTAGFLLVGLLGLCGARRKRN